MKSYGQGYKKFQGKIKNYKVSMKMTQSNKILVIEIEDTITFNKYLSVVDQEYIIKNKDDYINILQNPLEIFEYLSENFDQIIIQEGIIKFDCVHGFIKKVKTFTLEASKQKIDELQLAHKNIEKLKVDLIVQQVQWLAKTVIHQQKVQILQNKLVEASLKMDRTQKENEQLKQKLIISQQIQKELRNCYEQRIKDLIAKEEKAEEEKMKEKRRFDIEKEKVYNLLMKLQENNELIAQYQKQIQIFRSQERMSNFIQQQKATEEILKQIKKLKNKQQLHYMMSLQTSDKYNIIVAHPNNPNQKYYSVSTNKGNRKTVVTRKGENGFFNFVNKYPILPNQKAKYSVKLTKVSYNHLLLGFCTEQFFLSESTFSSPQSAYFYLNEKGSLLQGEQVSALNIHFNHGDVIDCIVDLKGNTITWSKKQQKFAQCIVPSAMFNKAIYLSVFLLNKDDEITIEI